jgi:transcriptional regulator with XRE-family HTH domain
VKTTIVRGRKAPTTSADSSAAPDFRRLLCAELARRCAGNPRYSLRAFAKGLGVDHATLSQLLRGRRTLTEAMIRRLARRLKLDEAAIQDHIAVAQRAEGAPREPGSLREVRQLTADAASLVQQWQHFAILELTRLDSFKPDSRWIARVLGISIDEVNIALQQLIRLNLLEMASPTRWVDRTGDAAITVEGLAHLAVQNLAQQTRHLAERALARPDPGLCDYSTTTVAVSTARLPDVIEHIARFRRELLAMLERDATRDDLYQLDISFYPVTSLQHGGDAHDTGAPPERT